jgi:hypothetical protein
VEDFVVVEGFEAAHHVAQGPPDLTLGKPRPVFFVGLDCFEYIPASRELHDNAEGLRRLIIEGLLVANNKLVAQGGQDPNLIDRILPLFLAHGGQLDLLEGVLLAVQGPSHPEHLPERALSQLLQDREISKRGCHMKQLLCYSVRPIITS